MYSTRQRPALAGGGENMVWLRHQRNAARVFPLPVGASSRVDSPRAIAGQLNCWARVGDGKRSAKPLAHGGMKETATSQLAAPRS